MNPPSASTTMATSEMQRSAPAALLAGGSTPERAGMVSSRVHALH